MDDEFTDKKAYLYGLFFAICVNVKDEMFEK